LLIERRGASLDEVVERVTTALEKAAGGATYSGTASAVVVEARAT
jgi:hypothetical protein